jgi:hypothetical protein
MFQALLAHLKQALRKQQLIYFVRIVSAVCYQGSSSTPTLVVAPPEDEQVVLETRRGC